MSVRNHNLETVAPVLATFKIHQTAFIDDLKDANIGEPVALTGNSEIGLYQNEKTFIGKLVALTLCDGDDGERVATIQLGGVCRFYNYPNKKINDKFGRRGIVIDVDSINHSIFVLM